MNAPAKLTDTQFAMLSEASQRKDRCLIPPKTLKAAAAQKVATKLLKAGLVREIKAKTGAQVIELLQCGDGATLAELVAATGWLPHTTRAALTGLRRRGYAVGIDRADKVRGSVYRIEPTEMEDPFATRGPTTREGVGLKSGALLVREWNGRLERVMILDDGCAWNGCVYRSLSQVAKAITGTNWNGHRSFGLKAVRTGACNRKRNVTPRPDSLLDIGGSPTLAGFAPAMPSDRRRARRRRRAFESGRC